MIVEFFVYKAQLLLFNTSEVQEVEKAHGGDKFTTRY